ncbi:MAG: hypothetical protein KatS3mg111_1897 [Pirellulaceae bacterium]|nr:MAG: hypothetical protein KatS3mg111_1897 [Pirellulaceae bacterium]
MLDGQVSRQGTEGHGVLSCSDGLAIALSPRYHRASLANQHPELLSCCIVRFLCGDEYWIARPSVPTVSIE